MMERGRKKGVERSGERERIGPSRTAAHLRYTTSQEQHNTATDTHAHTHTHTHTQLIHTATL